MLQKVSTLVLTASLTAGLAAAVGAHDPDTTPGHNHDRNQQAHDEDGTLRNGQAGNRWLVGGGALVFGRHTQGCSVSCLQQLCG